VEEPSRLHLCRGMSCRGRFLVGGRGMLLGDVGGCSVRVGIAPRPHEGSRAPHRGPPLGDVVLGPSLPHPSPMSRTPPPVVETLGAREREAGEGGEKNEIGGRE
jgi:hypothetical protein